jgi:phospholipid-transporting ATPase
MLLILTSLYEDGNQCYVETANIDGETNLKLKEAPAKLLDVIAGNGTPRPELFEGSLEFEPPNKNIHNFIGAFHLKTLEEPISLGADNLLLRSSLFSNTDYGYGIAVYCGQETKIQMNNRHAPSKMSKIEGYVNKAIQLIFFAQVTLVTVSIISIYALGFDNKDDFPYLYPTGNDSTSVLPLWMEQWLVFFLLFNNFIPISLYVTIELVNLGQAYLISQDRDLYDPVLDMPCSVRSSNLAQELGLVSNIFSDKTGTLTRNEMKFVQFIVEGRMFYVNDQAALLDQLKKQSNVGNSLVYQFLLCLTTCHTVIREKNGTYRAESPDELALVEGAGQYECGLLERGTTSMVCEMLGKRKNFDVLAVNAFNSDRKRMSILIRDNESSEYYLMCKGADNIMLPLCEMSSSARSDAEKALLDLACQGLRTLCVARQPLTKQRAESWLKSYRDASNSLQDRAGRLAAVAADIEQGMELLGITAIEDRLQDEVPEVIADLAKAGIVLWMLTGDKEETAINIGHSCNLLRHDTKTFFLTRIEAKEDYNTQIYQVADEIEQCRLENQLAIANGEEGVEIALVMDGPSFKFFDETNRQHRAKLLQIGKACRSVIACRLTPVQKQQLVNLIKVDTKPKATTLSIGDGANDVSMIREADVGVGIFGKEGRQAANNADFAVGQFKFLRKLLLVHGRWNYCRQSKVFLYSMHKNMVITLSLFWYR